MSSEYIEAMQEDFVKVVEGFMRQLATIRTGRATPQLLDGVSVQVASYGAAMPLNQLASVSAPDARLLVVNPWDKGTLSDVEKAIMSSGLGLNPSSDGQIIRVPIPALTGDRRKELVRQVGKVLEDHKISARKVRKEYNDIFKDLENEKEITEDDLRRFTDEIQKSTDETVAKLDEVGKAKESELLEV